jgi:SsrA-binding protein
MDNKDYKIQFKNKKAGFEYHILKEFTAGMILKGTEIKSIRSGKANLSDSYCQFKGNELFVYNLHIAEYKFASYENHEPKRARKLLLNKTELRKLQNDIKQSGNTIVTQRLFVDERGRAKLDIALAKGKKLYDKRESIKEKDMKRDAQRMDF